MASLNDALTIARSGVLTHQERMAVISHNIANVDTKGYHRQRAVLGTNPPNEPNLYVARRYSIGTGVRVVDVVRLTDTLTESRVRGELSNYGLHDQLAASLGDIEALLNGDEDAALAARLQEFWTAWQDLANNADRLAFRDVVIGRGIALTEQLNLLASRLSDYRTSIAAGGAGPDFTGQVATTVKEINQQAAQVQDLNRKIAFAAAAGQNANDLCDRRDQLIRELAEKVNLTVATDYTLTIDGQLLVSGDGLTRNELQITNTAAVPITFALAGNPVNINGGRLGGYVEAAGVIDGLLTRLDTLASELVTQVNAIHSAAGSAYDLDGNPGIAFFTGTTAATIALNPLIHDPANPNNDNPRLIAAANTVHDPGPPVVPNVGDGGNALEIADLCRALIPGLGNQTFGSYWSAALSNLGDRVADEQALADDADKVIQMLDASIQSTDGVNLDEELVEMLSAQRAFEASSRVITTVNEMLDVVINRMG